MGALDTILSNLREYLPSFAKSDGSIEGKIIDVMASYADAETLERENTLNVINNALATQKVTTKTYYRRKAVEFQIGDTLVYDPINQGGYYDPIDEEKRIIRQAFIAGDYPTYTLLVNAVDAEGHLRELTADELAAFTTYFSAFEPIGMDININSLQVAQITDPNIVVYVRQGAEAATVADEINANLLAYESTFRQNNTVSLTEIEDVFQQQPDVVAIGFDNPIANEQQLDGSIVQSSPQRGIFILTNGAFSWRTPIATANIQVIQ